MSKLFETLEQIRRNESQPASEPPAAGSSVNRVVKKRKKQRSKRPFVVAALLLLVMGGAGSLIYYLPEINQRFKTGRDLTPMAPATKNSAIEANPPAGLEAPPPTPSLAAEQGRQPVAGQPASATGPELALPAIQLNNQAAELIRSGKHWEGIALLNQAIELTPQRVEPLINMGVALAELGLYGPATRYFVKARQLAPDNEKLKKNLELMRDTGFLDSAR